MTVIDRDLLARHHNFDGSRDLVLTTLREAMQTSTGMIRFLGRYTSWNGFFGSAVATLAGKIGRSRSVFLDPEEPIELIADRSVFVGSFFFDAARDEFDDRDTAHRDTHRCLAQAVVGGVLAYCRQEVADAGLDDVNRVNALLMDPPWLRAINHQVAQGYGLSSPDDLLGISRAMGYHLGSEVLADQEFTQIDQSLRSSYPELVAFLSDTEIEIAGQAHNAYQWISIHSGHGGGAEADHFEWAVQGVRRARNYVRPEAVEDLVAHVLLGFSDFARDHRTFFTNVNRA
jgi:hypothetical protein